MRSASGRLADEDEGRPLRNPRAKRRKHAQGAKDRQVGDREDDSTGGQLDQKRSTRQMQRNGARHRGEDGRSSLAPELPRQRAQDGGAEEMGRTAQEQEPARLLGADPAAQRAD